MIDCGRVTRPRAARPRAAAPAPRRRLICTRRVYGRSPVAVGASAKKTRPPQHLPRLRLASTWHLRAAHGLCARGPFCTTFSRLGAPAPAPPLLRPNPCPTRTMSHTAWTPRHLPGLWIDSSHVDRMRSSARSSSVTSPSFVAARMSWRSAVARYGCAVDSS